TPLPDPVPAPPCPCPGVGLASGATPMTKGASGAGFGGADNSGGRSFLLGDRCVRDGAAGAPPPATGAGLGGVWGGGWTGRGGIGDGRTSSTSTGREKIIGGASGRRVPSSPNRAR